jgi:hypothetical protein
MRSYDYCHFEISLGSDEDLTLDQVNDLRKQAALLVDEAVRQYKQASKAEEKRERNQFQMERVLDRIKMLEQIPENEWSPEDAALMRGKADREFWAAYEADDYFYGDQPDQDHHFSMLRRFQDVVISAANS